METPNMYVNGLVWAFADTEIDIGWQVGLLPMMLHSKNELPACKQLDAGYRHGGGWRPFKGFEMQDGFVLKYKGDTSLSPLARTRLRREMILVYEHAWVAVVQLGTDDEIVSFEVCRMD